MITVPERHRQTDGQKGGQTYCGITALCVASRGRKQVRYVRRTRATHAGRHKLLWVLVLVNTTQTAHTRHSFTTPRQYCAQHEQVQPSHCSRPTGSANTTSVQRSVVHAHHALWCRASASLCFVLKAILFVAGRGGWGRDKQVFIRCTVIVTTCVM